MTVRVRNLQSAPGTITNFSDLFAGIALGPQWSIGAWRTNNDGNNRFLQTISGGSLQTANDGGGNGQMAGYYVPNILTGIRNNNQFSQATLAVNNNGAGVVFSGPTAFMSPSSDGAYIMRYYCITPDFPNSRWILWRPSIGTSLNVPSLIDSLAIDNTLPVIGEVVRLEVRGVNSAQIDITVTVNGVTRITFSDNTALRAISGLPGLGFVFVSTGGAVQGWSNFSAGIL